jgi:apolipoprotein N-acyltransferase
LRGKSTFANGLLFAGCWLAAELARGQCFSGFPWIASGYAHTTGPLAALAPWVGVYGITAAAGLLAAAVAAVLRRLQRGPPAQRSGVWTAVSLASVSVAAPLVFWLVPSDFTHSTGRFSVSLLQPNVAQDLKFDPEHLREHLGQLRDQMAEAHGGLVVTPESVVPLPQADLDPDYWADLVGPYTHGGRGALIGTFLGNETEGYVNSLVGISAQAPDVRTAYHYGKRHLLPFGEYVPTGFRWFVDLLQIPLGDQASGQTQALFDWGGQRFRPLICYEDLFGEEFAGSTLGPQAATVLVNASNLAWFGPWMMQDQHLQFSRMRALEFQRPLIRATNTGATAVVDHHGRVAARLPGGLPGILEAELEGRLGDTPYALWVARFGLAPAWCLALGLVLLPAGISRRRVRLAT